MQSMASEDASRLHGMCCFETQRNSPIQGKPLVEYIGQFSLKHLILSPAKPHVTDAAAVRAPI